MNKKFGKLTKAVVVVMSMVMLLSCIGILAKPTTVNAGLVGDVNEDGIVNSKDLSMVQKIILGTYEEKTPVPTVTPHVAPMYNGTNFSSVEELTKWINQKDKYEPAVSIKWINAVNDDGGILVPSVDGVSLLDIIEERHLRVVFGEDSFNLEGKGYSYRFKSEDLSGICWIYLLDEEDQEAAAEDLTSYYYGKYFESSDERTEALNKRLTTFDLNGVTYEGYYYPKSEDGYPDRDRIHFVYNKRFIVHFDLFESSKEDLFEVTKKLTFDILPIEIDEEVLTYVEPTPPYGGEIFYSMDDFKQWVNDENKKEPEASQKLRSSIERDGGIFVPCVDGASITTNEKYALNLNFGVYQPENHGYGYVLNYDDDFVAQIHVYFIDDENVAAATEDPIRYLRGGYNSIMDEETAEAMRQSCRKVEFRFGDEIYNGIYFPSEYAVYFIYKQNHMIRFSVHESNDATKLINRISFEFLPVEFKN